MEASGSTPTQEPTQQAPYTPAAPAVYAGVELASWGSRVGAAIIDGICIGIPAGIIYAATTSLAIYYPAAIAVGIAYWGMLYSREGERNGQSLGKQAVGIRVRRDDGETMDFAHAILRETLVKTILVGIACALVVGILDYLWPLWDKENRAVHDMIVSTHVVKA